MSRIQGVVQGINFAPAGGRGGQVTTINGVPYVTFWDIRDVDWKEGDLVEFEAVHRSLWEGAPREWFAQEIRRVVAPAEASEVDELTARIRAEGLQPTSVDQALRMHSSGWRVFVFSEMDEEPAEAVGRDAIEMIRSSVVDQILVLPPDDIPQDSPPAVQRPAA